MHFLWTGHLKLHSNNSKGQISHMEISALCVNISYEISWSTQSLSFMQTLKTTIYTFFFLHTFWDRKIPMKTLNDVKFHIWKTCVNKIVPFFPWSFHTVCELFDKSLRFPRIPGNLGNSNKCSVQFLQTQNKELEL